MEEPEGYGVKALARQARDRLWAAVVQDHTLARTYEAIVTGNLRDGKGTIDAPIARHHTDRKKMAVTPGREAR